MTYKSSIKNWEGLAQNDALWSILTDGKKKGEKWDKEQFFQSGQAEVNTIMDYLKKKGFAPVDHESALDFGCGVGRISRALSNYFDEVTGVDASPTMVDLANAEHKDYPKKLNFVVNPSEDLRGFNSDSRSMVFSVITLQHIPAEQSLGFIKDFIRIIKPGGLVVFQIPTKDVRQQGPISRLRSYLRIRERLALFGIGKGFQMSMYPVSEEKILQACRDLNAQVLDVVNTNQTEPDYNGKVEFLTQEEAASGYISRLFVITK